MNKWTKEEVSLCKQIAKKHRKEIKRGDWYNDLNVGDGNLDICNFNQGVYWTDLNKNKKVIPLWTISDCLEFLREKGFRYDLEDYHVSPNDLIYLIMSGGKRNVNRLTFDGKTLLEPCLKAVLTVLEGDKS